VLLADPREFVQGSAGSVWSFPIGTSISPRNGRLVLFAGDCQSSSTDRLWWNAAPGAAPASLVGGPHEVDNVLNAANGQRMDVLTQSVAIPPWASYVAYQLQSPNDGTGDSIVHFFGAFCSDGNGTFCTGSIGGTVFHDDDRDGVQDPGETGLAGVSMQLQDGAGNVLTTSSTDASGAFSFSPLCAGSYAVVVDAATLPPGAQPTSCGVGSCSPQAVTLPADDSSVSGLSFGYGDAAPVQACFLGLRFWRNEFRQACGPRPGLVLSAATLQALLPIVQQTTNVDWTGGDGVLSFADVAAALNRSDAKPCRAAEAQYLACLLNYALDGTPSNLMVDVTGDGVPDMTWGQMIAMVEGLFSQRSLDNCQRVQSMAASVNAMPSSGCPYQN